MSDSPTTDHSSAGHNPPLPNSRKALDGLLCALIDQPERHTAIVAEIEARFSQDCAILALDMTGFSRTTRKHGVVPFLLMIHQMQRIACPCIVAHGGKLIKTEADDLFCVFDTVDAALASAKDIRGRLELVNLLLPEDRHLYASIGIGYGHILIIEEHDLFGDEVNLACKLGEDIAAQGAILLTAQARQQLTGVHEDLREDEVSLSGLSLVYYELAR